jgi:hypothetical protein
MSRKRIFQLAGLAVAAVLVVGIAAPYIDAEGYHHRIVSALERALNRRVQAGKVRFNLFTGPGFTVENVQIADDASIGIEPLAYVESLEARVTLRTLWTRKLAFSNLKLHDPTLNLVQNEAGVWNFQLLETAPGVLPSIQVRNGRINFKFGDTKSVFYLSNSDLDIHPLDANRMDVRFAGQPARTDQAAQSFGMLLARGTWKRSAHSETELDVNAELERSAITELAKFFEGRGIGLHGAVSAEARISGPISKLAISGQIKLDDVHRWNLMPKGGGWQLRYRGQLDLASQRLELETAEQENPGAPVTLRYRASEILSKPRWAASMDLREVPAAALVDAARHMGMALPEGVQVEGKLNGAIGYSRPGGFQGRLAAVDATLRAPATPVLKFESAEVVIDGGVVNIGPSRVEAEGGQTAELTAEYRLDDSAVDVKIATAGMAAAEIQKGVGVQVPVLGGLQQGTWKGALRYQRSGSEEGAWTGDFDVRDATVDVDGLAEPVRLASASISVNARRIAVTRMRGRAGEIRFTGEYRSEPARPDRLMIEIPEAGIVDMERLLLPSLQRRQGILARFRLRTTPAPEWLRGRKLEARVSVPKLTAGEQVWNLADARIAWNGVEVKLSGVRASSGDIEVEGEGTIDLAGVVPVYKFTSSAGGIGFKGGTLSLEGVLSSRGAGTEFLANARAEGTFEGEDIAFAPEVEFRSISGAYEWSAPARLRVKNVQAGQGFENYTGSGATQPDGKLLLDLTTGKRQVKVAGTWLGSATRGGLKPTPP